MTAKDYMRYQLLQDILQKMTPEERQAYIVNASKQKQHQELLDAIHARDGQIDRIAKKVENQNWLTSFTSDVLANFTSAGVLWLGSKLLKKF